MGCSNPLITLEVSFTRSSRSMNRKSKITKLSSTRWKIKTSSLIASPRIWKTRPKSSPTCSTCPNKIATGDLVPFLKALAAMPQEVNWEARTSTSPTRRCFRAKLSRMSFTSWTTMPQVLSKLTKSATKTWWNLLLLSNRDNWWVQKRQRISKVTTNLPRKWILF